MNFKNLPLYRIVVDPDEEETGMTCISLVDDPAIEKDFLCFNKDEKRMAFAVQDEAKHIVSGPAIINGMPIYRRSAEMGEYMVVFDEETIDNIVLKYSKFNMWNNVSLQHNGENLDNVIMVEYFKKDSEKGIVPKGFEDVADGSLFVSYKVLDDELWNQIVNGDDLKGFSIEVNADLEPTGEKVDDGYGDMDDELDALLRELLGEDFDWLWSTQKKKSFASDLSVIEKAIEGEKELSIKYGDRTIKGTPYSIFDNRGSRNVVLYDGKDWRILNERNITNITETGNKGLVNWGEAIKQPDFGWVTERIDKAVEVDNINPNIPKNDYERAIVEHRPAMVTYIDEVGRETGVCVGNRQVQTMEIGFTKKGNACLRVYQHFGPTHHTDDPIPAWRNLRLDRIRSFKIVDWLEPYTTAPIGFNETGPDRDGFTCTLRSDLKIG